MRKPNCTIEGENGHYKCYDRFDVAEIGYNEHREINRLVITNAKTGNVVFEYGTPSNAQKAPIQPSKTQAEQVIDDIKKRANRGRAGRENTNTGSNQMATAEQKDYIKTNANDEDYVALMEQYGAELENMTANQASEAISMVNAHNSNMAVTCERCGKAITGIALPDGTTLKSSEVIARSKMKFNGVFCVECAKALDKKRKAV